MRTPVCSQLLWCNSGRCLQAWLLRLPRVLTVFVDAVMEVAKEFVRTAHAASPCVRTKVLSDLLVVVKEKRE